MNRPSDWLTLIVPTAIATLFTLAGHGNDRVLALAAPVLLGMWAVMMLAVCTRSLQTWRANRRALVPVTARLGLHVLTGAGRSLMWASAGAIAFAVVTGWASMSVLGVLGFASVYLSVVWTQLVAGSDAPWRDATIERTLLPESAREGDPVREHLRLLGIRIPVGMRLFVTGTPLRNGAVTRFTAGAEASRGELELDSELGPAPRGEHRAPPLVMWLGDVLGLARGPIVTRGEASLTVLPRPSTVDGARALLGTGGQASTSVQTQRMPTEGTFRIREYVPGDDTRRIHWVRSLQADQLVVRLPDEIPPAEPRVRVVLDNQLAGAEWLTCLGSEQLLDALVRVWLGVGKALAETGARVTMVAAIDDGAGPTVVERPMIARTPREAVRLGARVRWQGALRLSGMVDGSSATLRVAARPGEAGTCGHSGVRQIVITSRPRRIEVDRDVAWVVVPDAYFTTLEPMWRDGSPAILPYAIGSGDNRMVRRRAEQLRLYGMHRDRAALTDLLWTERAVEPGVFVARPRDGRVALEVAS